MRKLLAVLAWAVALLAVAPLAEGSTTMERGAGCGTINLGEVRIFYKHNMRCSKAKHYARRLYKTDGHDEPRNFSCDSGSSFNEGGACSHDFKNKYFGWHPADKRKGMRVGPGVYLAAASSVVTAPDQAESRPREPDPRIVGGVPTSIDQFPWQVAVAYSTLVAPGNGFERFFCGGSLVTPTVVLTAAHCLTDENGVFLPPAVVSVISGRTQLSSSDGQESSLADYHTFTDGQGNQLYDPVTGAWDVAIVELAQGSTAGTIKLAGPDEAQLWAAGRVAYASGWGAVAENGSYPDGLLSTEIVVLPDRSCRRQLGKLISLTTSLCAGTALGNRGICSGDSGGPLVVPMADGNWRLVGDTQAVVAGCGSVLPNIYGRLADDPVRGALRNAVLDIAGVDIVGSGGQAPTVLTPSQARENAWIYVDEDCARWRPCRTYSARRCSVSGTGFRCNVKEFAKNRRYGRFRCKGKVYVSAANGSIERRGLRKWKCRRGWS